MTQGQPQGFSIAFRHPTLTTSSLRYWSLPAAALLAVFGGACTEDVDPDEATGGGPGTGGTSGQGGSSTTGGVPAAACAVPANGTLADMSTSGSMLWGTSPAANGGFFAYPDEATATTDGYPGSGFAYDTLDGTWNIAGVYGIYAGFGMWIGCTVDASSYTGVRFTVSDPGGMVTNLRFSIFTSQNWFATGNARALCMLPEGMTTDADGVCDPAFTMVPVTTTPTTVEVPFEMLSGGIPEATVTTSQIEQLQWDVTATMGMTVDLALDDIGFY